jgi:hypothetical protein
MAARLGALAILVSVLAAPCLAQLPGIGFSAGVQGARPGGDFAGVEGGPSRETGYGAYLAAHLDAVLLGLEARVEGLRFGASAGGDATTAFGGRVGPRLGGGPIRVGFDVGRYTEIDRTGYTPNLSLALGPLEAGAGITFFSGGRWLALSAGMRF